MAQSKKVSAKLIREGKPTIILEGTEDAAGNQMFDLDAVHKLNQDNQRNQMPQVGFSNPGSTVVNPYPLNDIAEFKKGVLHYRGEPIHNLVTRGYPGVAYYVVHGREEYPNIGAIPKKVIRNFDKRIVESMGLDDARMNKIQRDLELITPESTLAQIAGTFGAFAPKRIQTPEDCENVTVNMIGRTTFAALAINRLIRGLEPIEADRRYGTMHNVAIQALEGTPNENLIKDRVIGEAFKRYFIVHMAHGWPLSTCAQLDLLSGKGEWYNALEAAIKGLNCNLHAYASTKTLEMYRDDIREPRRAKAYVRLIAYKKEVGLPTEPLYSLGHRVAKNGDARVPLVDGSCESVEERLQRKIPYRAMAKAVVAAAAKEPFFEESVPNVDNLGGALLHGIGAISDNHFEGSTLMFAAARSVGLAATQRHADKVKMSLSRAYQPTL